MKAPNDAGVMDNLLSSRSDFVKKKIKKLEMTKNELYALFHSLPLTYRY